MLTATLFYVVLTLMLVAPLILFNVKKFQKKEPGKPARPNVVRIVTVFVLSAFIIVFMYSLCVFSYDYQALLVGERYMNEFGKMRTGSLTKEEFLRSTASLTQYDPAKYDEFVLYLESVPHDADSFSYQMSDEIVEKKFLAEPSIFRAPASGAEAVYLLINGKTDSPEACLVLLRRENYAWKVEDFYPATQEIVDFARKNSFLRGDQVVKWFTVNKT